MCQALVGLRDPSKETLRLDNVGRLKTSQGVTCWRCHIAECHCRSKRGSSLKNFARMPANDILHIRQHYTLECHLGYPGRSAGRQSHFMLVLPDLYPHTRSIFGRSVS